MKFGVNVKNLFKAMATKFWSVNFENKLRDDVIQHDDESRETLIPSYLENSLIRRIRSKDYVSVLRDIRKIKETLTSLQLPIPHNKDEFLCATEGVLLFLNDYGVVIRIELNNRNIELSKLGFAKVDNHPHILQPLFEIETEYFSIGIFPGCKINQDQEIANVLRKKLQQDDVNFWDDQPENVGLIPLSTLDKRAQDIPVVIDVTAVETLSKSVQKVRAALDKKYRQKNLDAQARFYEPLRKAFVTAWDPETHSFEADKVREAWSLCLEYKKQGKLIPAWDNGIFGENTKSIIAQKIGRTYQAVMHETPSI